MSPARRQCAAIMAFACVLGVICFTAAGSRRAAAQGLGLGLRSIRTSARANVNPLISRQMDLRPAIQASVGSKCVPVNSVATICGKMVVLRPPTAVRAEESTVDADKILEDIGSKFNSIENKSQVAIYAGTSIIALLLANGLVTTIDAIPVLPYFMKLVGTGYSTWFIYRYLLFDDSRKELQEDLEAIRKKITGEGME